MLQIVDDQDFGGAQFFFEGERILAVERPQEMAHEILGTQKQRPLSALAKFQRGGIGVALLLGCGAGLVVGRLGDLLVGVAEPALVVLHLGLQVGQTRRDPVEVERRLGRRLQEDHEPEKRHQRVHALDRNREHGHALTRGVSANAIMAEMFGKQTGCSHGRGGSMHLFDAATRFYGGNAIVGGGLPLATGLALADKLQQKHAVTACFFGEGAMAEGAFHESLNLAALWQLPVVFFCENNLYAMGTALARSESQTDLCAKAAAYQLPALRVDGMDVVAVHEAARTAVQTVRDTGKPYFVEFQTYRFRAHSMFDAELYRDKAEVEEWKKHGPIHNLTGRLKVMAWLTEEDFQTIDAEALREVDAAIAFAEASPWEPVETLTRDVYAAP